MKKYFILTLIIAAVFAIAQTMAYAQVVTMPGEEVVTGHFEPECPDSTELDALKADLAAITLKFLQSDQANAELKAMLANSHDQTLMLQARLNDFYQKRIDLSTEKARKALLNFQAEQKAGK